MTADNRLAKLEADAQAGLEASQKLAENEAKAFISAAIKDGRIKTGESDNAVKLLLASKGDQRTQLEAFIKGLPVNASLGQENGTSKRHPSTRALTTSYIQR